MHNVILFDGSLYMVILFPYYALEIYVSTYKWQIYSCIAWTLHNYNNLIWSINMWFFVKVWSGKYQSEKEINIECNNLNNFSVRKWSELFMEVYMYQGFEVWEENMVFEGKKGFLGTLLWIWIFWYHQPSPSIN